MTANTLLNESAAADSLYLELIKKCLMREIGGDRYTRFRSHRALLQRAVDWLNSLPLLSARNIEIVRRCRPDAALRLEGLDWPSDAETMIGRHRLDNLQFCVTDIIRNDVPGDLIETGVWRGGASIFMKAVLQTLGDFDRTVWLADSFQGLPKPDPERYPADEGDRLWAAPELAVSVDMVKGNFQRYGLLDERVRFLVGWFRDTLPAAPMERLALLRLDGDMYESTIDALRALYPKLSVGGYVIVDDYGTIDACRQAVSDYRAELGIEEPIVPIDRTGVYWQRLQ